MNSEVENKIMKEVHKLEERMNSFSSRLDKFSKTLEKVEKNEDKVGDIHEFLFEKHEVSGRTVVDDLKLLRSLYNNFSGFSAAFGFLLGFFTVGIPIILGLLKLWEIINKFFK